VDHASNKEDRDEMTGAKKHLRMHDSRTPNPKVLLAAIEALPESVAIAVSGSMIYANPAWHARFEPSARPQPAEQAIKPPAASQSLSIVRGENPRISKKTQIQEMNSGKHTAYGRPEGASPQFETVTTCFDVPGSEFQSSEFKVIQLRDVSREQQVEKQLMEVQTFAAVGRLVGGVAHDFNNLLTGIMLYCDLLTRELDENSRALGHLQQMRAAGENGAAMVQQLLAISRPADGQAREFALNDVVTSIEDLLTRLIGENITLKTVLAENLGPVRMDSARVQQILLNLVLNARDAVPDGGLITVTTRNSSDPSPQIFQLETEIVPWVELTVSDNGCGMDAETLSQAFEPFFTTKKAGCGNGLGLATARWLAQREGGNIVVESQPGMGTRVSLRLPQAPPETSLNSKVER
jgi:signal transduction histidine kinase